MVLWGAIWGAVLGLLWPGRGWEFQSLVGLALGALAGHTLRQAIRKELAGQATVPKARPAVAAPQPPAATAMPEGVLAPALTPAPIAATAPAPGYDSGQQLQPGADNGAARGATFTWATGSGVSIDGGGETDPQTATSGHL